MVAFSAQAMKASVLQLAHTPGDAQDPLRVDAVQPTDAHQNWLLLMQHSWLKQCAMHGPSAQQPMGASALSKSQRPKSAVMAMHCFSLPVRLLLRLPPQSGAPA